MLLKTPSSENQALLEKLAALSNVPMEQLVEIWETAVSKQAPFQEQIIKSGLCSEGDYQLAVSQVIGLEFVDNLLSLPNEFQEIFTQKIPIRFAKKFLFFPYQFDEDQLSFAVVNPWPSAAYEMATNTLERRSFSMVIATQNAILEAINQAYDRNASSAEEVAEVLEDDSDLHYLDHFSVEETEDLLDAEDEEPIKKLMNSIIFQSVKDNSSDIHIDPTPKETIVRNRIDGILHQITAVPKQGHIPLVNRVKVMAGLDISTKNQPQDGRTMILLAGKKIDIRVSIIPTVYGEQAVMRLLNQSHGIIQMKDLGLSSEMADQIERLTQQMHGILLVTGPTGSGKTTTLYSALSRVNANEKNIVTIEDPVEYRISKYGQMQVNEKIGVNFAKGLRAMLRQDPDIIMIGEMRDTETAQIAIQASLTGHLVLSTVHTNEASATIIRLIDMGIEPYLVSSTVSAVLAQRLVRRICPHCKETYPFSWDQIKGHGFGDIFAKDSFPNQLWRGKGCPQCMNTGYHGRVGIFELLLMDESIRQVISNVADSTAIKKAAVQSGMRELKYDCAQKVLDGITSLDEMIRVVMTEPENQMEAI
jgi:general secretion pathway protein E